MSARCRSVVAPANALSRVSSSATVSRRSSGDPASQRHRSRYSICAAASLWKEGKTWAAHHDISCTSEHASMTQTELTTCE